jgi:hypothetical protein
MAFNWKDVLSKVAPASAALLGGPFAGLAVQALGDALGVSDPTTKRIQEALTNGQLTGEQIVALKTAEMQVQQHLQDNDIQLESILAGDRESARQRQVSTGDKAPVIIGFGVILITAFAHGALLLGFEPHIAPELVGRILGTWDMATGMVLAFFLGATHASARTTELLAKSTQPS